MPGFAVTALFLQDLIALSLSQVGSCLLLDFKEQIPHNALHTSSTILNINGVLIVIISLILNTYMHDSYGGRS